MPETLEKQSSSMHGTGLLSAVIEGLPSISLEELPVDSALLTRTDRKYLLDQEGAVAALAAVDGLVGVRVEGLAASCYESVYFDTPEHRAFRDAATGRRRRFKIRTRTYLDSGDTFVEVKVKTGRGDTHKERIAVGAHERASLSSASQEFVAMTLERNGLSAPQGIVDNLVPTLRTTYRRSTLLGPDGSRITIDTQLRCEQGEAEVSWPGLVLVETKAEGNVTLLDRALWRQGIRPVSFSKFAAGMLAFEDSLPHNKWHRVLGKDLLRRAQAA